MLERAASTKTVGYSVFSIQGKTFALRRHLVFIPCLSCKAIFVDTDGVPALESKVGDLTQNVTEACLVHQVTECLIRGGVQQQQIGVISLYRQQIKLLSYVLQEWSNIDILTADRSQGRDKDCIIISMVRSNDLNQVTWYDSLAILFG